MKKNIIGVDLSKDWFDAAHLCSAELMDEKRFDNNLQGVRHFVKWATKLDALVCVEHTGHYGLLLCCMLQQNGITFSLIPAIQIKKSQGIVRGKNDKADARRIAYYALTHQHKITLTRLPSSNILKLKELLTYRDQLVSQSTALQNSLKSHKQVAQVIDFNLIVADIENQLTDIKKRIAQVDQAIQSIVNDDQELKQNFALATSVKGIGPIIAAFMLVSTHNFTTFENGRKFACYSGIAPFEHSSGTSIRGNTRVSQYGNRRLKTLLYNGANSACQFDPEIRAYSLRKKSQGKKHLQIINAVACKLVNRVFAVIKRQSPYVSLYENNFAR